MKTAVSIPTPLFERADDQARRLGISRSELYARALESFLGTDDDEITAKLDEIYAVHPSGVDPGLRTAQARALGKSDW